MFKALGAARGGSGGDVSFQAGILPHTMALLCIKQVFSPPLGVWGCEGRGEGSLWDVVTSAMRKITAPQLGSTFGGFFFFQFLFFSPGEIKNRERKPNELSLQETNPPCCCSRPSQKMSVLRKQNRALAFTPARGAGLEGRSLHFPTAFLVQSEENTEQGPFLANFSLSQSHILFCPDM